MTEALAALARREKIADGVIHALGIAASITAAVILLIIVAGTLPLGATLAVAVYAATLVAVFAASAGYHMVPWPALKPVLRRIDHAAIYFKIAGTYTPFALLKMATPMGYALLAAVWAIGLFGAALKLFLPGRLERTSYALYLLAGWAGLFALGELLASLSVEVLVLLGIGGVLYTVGVVFHLWHRLPYNTAVWHGFVLAASACHFAAIVCVVAPDLA